MGLIVFLDIDGVVKDPKNHNLWYQNSIELINEMVEEYNAEIVISSTWRFLKNKSFFNKLFNEKVIGFTEDLSFKYENVNKEIECLKYIRDNNISEFVFIDDKEIEFPTRKKELVLTEEKKGFNKESALRFKEIVDMYKKTEV